jgi:H+/Cl- antiporter ClcA
MDHVYTFVNFIILGLLVGAFGFGIRMFEFITGKYGWVWPSDILHRDIDFGKPVSSQNYFIAYVVFIVEALIYVIISASLVIFIAPQAAGSGIPQTIAYMNGIEQPGFINFTTLMVTAISTVLSVACGLRIGKEGPMVHIGVICGVLTLYYLPWSTKFQTDK